MTEVTIGAMIDRYKEIEAYVDAEQADHDKRIKPYLDAMKLINAQVLGHLQANGMQNYKTEEGNCAYQQTIMSAKVDNRAEFLQFAAEHVDFLQAGVMKEPVKDYLDKNNGTPPPGVKVEFITKCNIRKG